MAGSGSDRESSAVSQSSLSFVRGAGIYRHGSYYGDAEVRHGAVRADRRDRNVAVALVRASRRRTTAFVAKRSRRPQASHECSPSKAIVPTEWSGRSQV